MAKNSKYVRETYKCAACCTSKVAGCIVNITLLKDHDPLIGCIIGHDSVTKAKWKKINKKQTTKDNNG